MQTFEALFSLLFLLLIASLLVDGSGTKIDTRLHTQHVASDVWRVLYLKGYFENWQDSNEDEKRKAIEIELKGEALGGYCIFIEGLRVTNCRGIPAAMLYTTEKTIIKNGVPQNVSFSLQLKE